MTEYFVRKPQSIVCQRLESESDLVGHGWRFDKRRLRSYCGVERLVIKRQAGELIAELLTVERKGPIRTIRGLRMAGVEDKHDLWLQADEWDGTQVFIYRLAGDSTRKFRIEFFWSNGSHADKLPTARGNIEFGSKSKLAKTKAVRTEEQYEDDEGDGYHED